MISGARQSTALFPVAIRFPIGFTIQLRHVLLMVLLTVLSSLGYIYLKYRMQERFLELNQLDSAWYQLHEQNDRLSLERQTLLARASILAKASKAGMRHHR